MFNSMGVGMVNALLMHMVYLVVVSSTAPSSTVPTHMLKKPPHHALMLLHLCDRSPGRFYH